MSLYIVHTVGICLEIEGSRKHDLGLPPALCAEGAALGAMESWEMVVCAGGCALRGWACARRRCAALYILFCVFLHLGE
ncbi:hypothetical protein A2U01_0079661 [Trifolium medium]|uniref:Uncharacterized protein n=1 Tax=Trifolium medium TaxID=97028 RepID=A0A392TE70_9FABA|nr:hypothetical protein [Trifolium medium]